MKGKSALSGLNKWLGTVLLVAIMVLAATFRLYQLSSLPPGIHPSEAGWAVVSFKLAQNHSFGTLLGNSMTGFAAPVAAGAIVASVVKSFVALRYLNAVWGVLMVLGLYLWIKDGFGRRAALLASLVAAISPWAVTLSRNVWPINLALAALVWLCFFAQRAYKTGKWGYTLAAAGTMILGCFSARVFWVVPVLFLLYAIILLAKGKLGKLKAQSSVVTVAFMLFAVVPLVVLGFLGKGSPAAGLVRTNLSHTEGSVGVVKVSLENAGKTALMFFTAGDEDYSRNLGGLPMFNTFAGLMLLLGVLLAVKYRHRFGYMFVVMGFGALLLPAIIGVGVSAPDAYRSALAMPFAFALAGLGTNYLLTRWYMMFPINTTARNLGLSFVLLLMLLSAYQGYRQYFIAWAQDPLTVRAYRDDLVSVADYQKQQSGKVYVVATGEELAVVAAHNTSGVADGLGGSIEGLEQLPLSSKPRYVVIPRGDKQASIKQRVAAKFPGGKFVAQNSTFDDAPAFVWYKTP